MTKVASIEARTLRSPSTVLTVSASSVEEPSFITCPFGHSLLSGHNVLEARGGNGLLNCSLEHTVQQCRVLYNSFMTICTFNQTLQKINKQNKNPNPTQPSKSQMIEAEFSLFFLGSPPVRGPATWEGRGRRRAVPACGHTMLLQVLLLASSSVSSFK